MSTVRSLGFDIEQDVQQDGHYPAHYRGVARSVTVRIGSRELDVVGSAEAVAWMGAQHGRPTIPASSLVFTYGDTEPAAVLTVLARWADGT